MKWLVANSTSLNISWGVLMKLSYTVCVYIIPDVNVMEMWCGILCEACCVNEEYAPATGGIFMTLSKESLEIFLAWLKIE
jgi:hypothetical protein